MKIGGAVDADHSFAVYFLDGQIRTEPAQHAFGVIARRNRFDHCSDARRVEAGKENRALYLSAGDRQFVGNGHGRLHPFHDQGECAAGRSRKTGPHGRQRVDDPAHRPFRKTCVAGKSCGDAVACHQAHQKSGRCAGIAHFQRLFRLQQSPDANPVDDPIVTITVDRCAHCAQGRGGGKNVFALEQPGNAAAPDGQRSEHQGAVTDRLVAGHTDASGQGG